MTPTIPSTKLNNGVKMPVVGAGMYQVPPGDTSRQVAATALRQGYRHLDTAQAYRNEADVGQALRDSGLSREDVFVTTKLSPRNAGFATTRASLQESLRRLQTSYADLFLIHWPVQGLRTESWKAMEGALSEGYCRAIGVSNYTIRHLQELEETAEVLPAVNQVEFHPFLYQKDLLQYCQKKGIQLEAYAPLSRGEKINHPVIQRIAHETRHTPAQVMLRWALQHELVVIPKSVHEERLMENLRSVEFRLDSVQMQALDTLPENLRTCWDPTDAP